MSVFVDTSGILAVLDERDEHHAAADSCWEELLRDREALVTTSYVLIEACALVQSRLGLSAVRALRDEVHPVFSVEWVTADLHDLGMDVLLTRQRRRLSLVDCVSFQAMRFLGITRAFALDHHFAEEGFEVIPRGA